MSIPYHISAISNSDSQYLNEIINNNQLATMGAYTQLCQEWLTNHAKTHKVVLTHSCSGALEISAILADIGPGDEVIMPSFTFVSTANAVVLRGGVPVFVDIRPDTLNMDENLIEAAITERTKAIMPVHYAAVGCEMNKIKEIAKRNQLLVIEDAAQCMWSNYHGQWLGAIGDLGCYSFHNTKNITSGQGGALLINNEQLIARAQIILEKGTNRAAFLEGLVDKYTWVDVGSSFTMSELNAALLWSQLQQSQRITEQRVAIWQRYYDGLKDLPLQLPVVPDGCAHNGHIFYIILPSQDMRNEVMGKLKEQGIHAVYHYVPLHDSPAGQRFARVSGELTHTNDLCYRLLRLPLWHSMDQQVDQVIAAVREICTQLLECC